MVNTRHMIYLRLSVCVVSQVLGELSLSISILYTPVTSSFELNEQKALLDQQLPTMPSAGKALLAMSD